MDSKSIKISSEAYKKLIEWSRITKDSEWIYFGEDQKMDLILVNMEINSFIESEIVYVAIDRNNSFECSRADLINKLKTLFGKNNFIVWNASFNKAIEFSYIGVFRKGKRASSQ